LQAEGKSLSQNGYYRPIPGWSLLLFGLAVVGIGFVALGFLHNTEMLTILGAFFAIGLL